MKLRSLLFVPGDRADRFDKAACSGADAVILDLEDSVSSEAKAVARRNIRDYLRRGNGPAAMFVRVNWREGALADADRDAIIGLPFAGIVLPKAESAGCVSALAYHLQLDPQARVLPLVAETARAVRGLHTFGAVADRLCAMAWGAEDLAADIGAEANRSAAGEFTPPFQSVRAQVLLSAAASDTVAIETVYPVIGDQVGLLAQARRARRDGFVGMLAIHPSQVASINEAFTPTEAELARASAIVALFEANPDVGCHRFEERMIDVAHLAQARRLLARR